MYNITMRIINNRLEKVVQKKTDRDFKSLYYFFEREI
jgi:hypothetical protein